MSLVNRLVACRVCGDEGLRELPIPGPRSMISDGRVIDSPRRLIMCMSCGLCTSACGQYSVPDFYGPAYSLNDSAPFAVATELRRHERYAAWISKAADSAASKIFEAGCGNGSLLKCLSERFPAAQLSGVDPAPRAVARARNEGLDVCLSNFESGIVPPESIELFVSVNVLEHVLDPVAFMRAARSMLAPGGKIILICPDGNLPSTELLVADHLFSFTRGALAKLAYGSGLTPIAWPMPPEPVGPFQMMVAKAGCGSGKQPSNPSIQLLFDDRSSYLNAWARLDDLIVSRLGTNTRVVAFGAGETADLIRTYAPAAWARVQACSVDDPQQRKFRGKNILPYNNLSPVDDQVILLAVHPDGQQLLASRLEHDGFKVVRWDDWLDNKTRSRFVQ